MDERAYLDALVKTVIQSQDSRIKSLLVWCNDVERLSQSCGGVAQLQNCQSAVAANEIILGINYVEESGESFTPHLVPSLLNEKDELLPMYYYTADFVKRTVTIDVALVSPLTGQRALKPITLQPVVISMRAAEHAMPTESKSSIITSI